MTRKYRAVRNALIVALLAGIPAEAAGPAERSNEELTLASIETCMASAQAPWPESWQREYSDTIRQAIASDANTPEYAARLDILRRGFPSYWEGLAKSEDRTLFEVQAAQIRWYVERLMAARLPSEQEKQTLREQYAGLWNRAASALLTQFPFLDPNGVQAAKAERIDECYRDIDAPLLPIFLQPFSQEQLDQIGQRWHDLRYARVDLWCQLAGGVMPRANQDAPPLDAAASRLLTQRSLAQLLSQIGMIGASPPAYYRSAVRNRVDAQRRAFESRSQAARAERALDRRYSRQLLQTEQLSFLLAALLETARRPASELPADQESPIQGGDPNVE